MIVRPNGRIRSFTIEEHLHQGRLVYRDKNYAIFFSSNKKQPFYIAEGWGKDMYIDLFALHFGQKEQLTRRTAKGFVPIQYGCSRCERDRILYLPVEQVVDIDTRHTCMEGCQYYSPPVGIKGKYVLNCILARYRAFEVLDFKGGLTLEEVGRIYGCTRERIRQIEEQAMRKMRHSSRLGRLQIFRERMSEYRDYAISQIEQIA